MKRPSKSLLVVGLEPELFARMPPMLWRSSFEVSAPENAELALRVIAERAFSLIVCRYPLPGVRFDRFLDEVRGFGSPCRGSSVLALAEPAAIEDAQAHVGKGLNRVVGDDASDEELSVAVADLLEVAPRVATRAPVSLALQAGTGEAELIAQTENVSTTGMLVRSKRRLPIGEVLAFGLKLPPGSRPVEGEGVVVRVARRVIDRADGFGVRFSTIFGEGARRLADFVDRELRERAKKRR